MTLEEMVEKAFMDTPVNEDPAVHIANAFRDYLKQNCPNCRELDRFMREVGK